MTDEQLTRFKKASTTQIKGKVIEDEPTYRVIEMQEYMLAFQYM